MADGKDTRELVRARYAAAAINVLDGAASGGCGGASAVEEYYPFTGAAHTNGSKWSRSWVRVRSGHGCTANARARRAR